MGDSMPSVCMWVGGKQLEDNDRSRMYVCEKNREGGDKTEYHLQVS